MLETHVTNLEQSRKLYELGFRRDSVFRRELTDRKAWTLKATKNLYYYVSRNDGNPSILWKSYPAYLLSEIMEALPRYITTENEWVQELCIDTYNEEDNRSISYWIVGVFENTSLITAACDLLIWCIENWFISVDSNENTKAI